MENPYPNNPHYKHRGSAEFSSFEKGSNVERVVPKTAEKADNGVEIHTQDIKSEEVTTDEPRPAKRRSKKRKSESESSEE